MARSNAPRKPQSSVLPQYVVAEAIATALACTPKHVYQLAATNRIPHTRIDGIVRFSVEKILVWLEDHSQAA
jgi:hypothetical protein